MILQLFRYMNEVGGPYFLPQYIHLISGTLTFPIDSVNIVKIA